MIKISNAHWNENKQRIVDGVIDEKQFSVTFDYHGFVVDLLNNLTQDEKDRLDHNLSSMDSCYSFRR